MDEIKPPQPYAIPGIILPSIKLPEFPTAFKELVFDQIFLRYQITIKMIRSKDRYYQIAYTRQMFCYIVRECYGSKAPLSWIANIINKADHTVVIHSVQAYKDLLESDAKIYHKLLPMIQGEKFATVREDYNHFKFLLYRCLKPNLDLSEFQAVLEAEKTRLQS